jgi:hypothetical protein
MSKQLKIAFGGHARVGKDTAAEYLRSRYSGVILHFADPIKEIMAFTQRRCGFDEIKDTKFLQFIGTEWAREHDPDVWVKLLLREVDGMPTADVSGTPTHIFVADLRFRNEAAALMAEGFTLIKIQREDRVIDRDPNHQSENDMNEFNDWDYVVENSGNIGELYYKLNAIVEQMGEA